MLAQQRNPSAEAPLREALVRIQPLFSDANLGRPARLAWAEAATWLLPLKPADAEALRQQALAALDEAAKALPLGADHAALQTRLRSPLE